MSAVVVAASGAAGACVEQSKRNSVLFGFVIFYLPLSTRFFPFHFPHILFWPGSIFILSFSLSHDIHFTKVDSHLNEIAIKIP